MRLFPALLLSLLGLLAGCGQTGPLYLPTEDTPAPPPRVDAPAEAPADVPAGQPAAGAEAR